VSRCPFHDVLRGQPLAQVDEHYTGQEAGHACDIVEAFHSAALEPPGKRAFRVCNGGLEAEFARLEHGLDHRQVGFERIDDDDFNGFVQVRSPVIDGTKTSHAAIKKCRGSRRGSTRII
jgi:hypothetical protein